MHFPKVLLRRAKHPPFLSPWLLEPHRPAGSPLSPASDPGPGLAERRWGPRCGWKCWWGQQGDLSVTCRYLWSRQGSPGGLWGYSFRVCVGTLWKSSQCARLSQSGAR